MHNYTNTPCDVRTSQLVCLFYCHHSHLVYAVISRRTGFTIDFLVSWLLFLFSEMFSGSYMQERTVDVSVGDAIPTVCRTLHCGLW